MGRNRKIGCQFLIGTVPRGGFKDEKHRNEDPGYHVSIPYRYGTTLQDAVE